MTQGWLFFMKKSKKRCWVCGSRAVIKWGKQVRKKNFKCKNRPVLFTRNAPEQPLENRLVWFKKWIIERQT
jgi:hypothetical protein